MMSSTHRSLEGKSHFPKMITSFPVLLFFVLVSLSDGASVSIITEDLESLVASKILMDHTSTGSEMDFRRSFQSLKAGTVAESMKNEKERDQERSTSTTEDSSSISNVPTVSTSDLGLIANKNSYEMSSPLHVARCRATCLEKFSLSDDDTSSMTTSGSSVDVPSFVDVDGIHLLPILRLRRKRGVESESNKKSITSCLTDSQDCFSCWKTCELLEPTVKSQTHLSPPILSPEEGETNDRVTMKGMWDDKKKEDKTNQVMFPCSAQDSSQCMAGCQVACSFYERLLNKNEKNEEAYHQGTLPKAFSSEPVVATKQESVVRIVPGKITWMARNSKDIQLPSSTSPVSTKAKKPVVYVVIQEYPDRKWRQIAQTVETEIDIPKELTSAMKTKLRSVRVLVVGPEGLLSVYSPETSQDDKPTDKLNVAGKRTTFEKESIETATTETEQEAQTGSIPVNTSANANDIVDADGDDTVTSSSAPSPSSSLTTLAASVTTDNLSEGVEEPFQLRRVSLIHQKSLVIAELTWNQIGSNPNQEYLITWELTGGGLKGHLVTDSTSVTLSLWPDTHYQIQVELFEQNLDSDGEQPTVSSAVSLRSLPLILDTSEASFPMGSPSALSSNNDSVDDNEYEGDEEDDTEQEGNEGEEEEESAHKSITGFLHMTLVLGISIAAMTLVLVILTLAAFSWTKIRSLSSCKSVSITSKNMRKGGCQSERSGCCYGRCFSYSSFDTAKEPQLLLSQEELWEDSCNIPAIGSKKSQLGMKKKGWLQFSLGTNQDKQVLTSASIPTTVAVISTSAALPNSSDAMPCAYKNYYCNGFTTPSSITSLSAMEEQGFPSSSFCWVPNASDHMSTTTSSQIPPATRTSSSSGGQVVVNIDSNQ